MPNVLSREHLVKETEAVLDAIANPVFIAKMQEFRERRGGERIEFARKEMNPKQLQSDGVKLPAGMRVSTRTFEEYPSDGRGNPLYVDAGKGREVIGLIQNQRPELMEKLKLADPEIYKEILPFVGPKVDPDFEVPVLPGFFDPDSPDFDPHGAWGCACGGAATICGGAGGGS